MSASIAQKRISVRDLAARKGGAPIVCLTAYTAPMALRLDPHVDLLLVGDSLGMVLYGMETTLPVTVEMMIAHGRAVMRGSKRACVVVDLPLASYQESREQAFHTASRILVETGCAAVKMEGGGEMAETARFLIERGIPVMGHVGLRPQAVRVGGGFRTQGRGEDEAARVLADARAMSAAGCFNIVPEGVVEPVSRALVEAVRTPVIGIGASAACDGQILVAEDVMGLSGDFTPKFVRQYARLNERVSQAAAAYAADVRACVFSAPEHCFGVAKD